MNKLTTLFLAGAMLAGAAPKQQQPWQTGIIRDAASSRTRSTLRLDQVQIVGSEYSYTIWDDKVPNYNNGSIGSFAFGAIIQGARNASHGCRYIVGDEIKYQQKGDKMKVIDTDGKTCNVIITRQERIGQR